MGIRLVVVRGAEGQVKYLQDSFTFSMAEANISQEDWDRIFAPKGTCLMCERGEMADVREWIEGMGQEVRNETERTRHDS